MRFLVTSGGGNRSSSELRVNEPDRALRTDVVDETLLHVDFRIFVENLYLRFFVFCFFGDRNLQTGRQNVVCTLLNVFRCFIGHLYAVNVLPKFSQRRLNIIGDPVYSYWFVTIECKTQTKRRRDPRARVFVV